MTDKLPSFVSEAAFLTQLMRAAQTRGWLAVHFRPARTSKGWRTAVQGDGAGFPDLVMCNERQGRVIFAELKSDRGKFTPSQLDWHRALHLSGQEAYLWRYRDWDFALVALDRRPEV